jgi:hypothetical protein
VCPFLAGCLGILEDAGYADAFVEAAAALDSSGSSSSGLAEVEGLWRWTGHVTEPICECHHM